MRVYPTVKVNEIPEECPTCDTNLKIYNKAFICKDDGLTVTACLRCGRGWKAKGQPFK